MQVVSAGLTNPANGQLLATVPVPVAAAVV